MYRSVIFNISNSLHKGSVCAIYFEQVIILTARYCNLCNLWALCPQITRPYNIFGCINVRKFFFSISWMNGKKSHQLLIHRGYSECFNCRYTQTTFCNLRKDCLWMNQGHSTVHILIFFLWPVLYLLLQKTLHQKVHIFLSLNTFWCQGT